jgi:hypothetical protein
MSEAVKEISFIYFILKDIGIEVELPIVVKSDNVGALFMSQNSKCYRDHLINALRIQKNWIEN